MYCREWKLVHFCCPSLIVLLTIRWFSAERWPTLDAAKIPSQWSSLLMFVNSLLILLKIELKYVCKYECLGILWAWTWSFRSYHGALAIRILRRERTKWRPPTSSRSGTWFADSSDNASHSVCLDPIETASRSVGIAIITFPSESYRSHKKKTKSESEWSCGCWVVSVTLLCWMSSMVERTTAGPSSKVSPKPQLFLDQMNVRFLSVLISYC